MSREIPRVSIGMPVFNGERYLEQAIDSILAQTFTDFEFIISDNASTDRTEEICRRYAQSDNRVRYYRNETNLGAGRNYDITFELSRGEYFRWAAYDDACAPEHLERCVAVLDSDPSVVLCYPRTAVIDENEKFVKNLIDGLDLRAASPHERYRHFHRRYEKDWFCNPVFGLIRSNILKLTGLTGNYNAADTILLAELALRGKYYEVPEYLFYRRLHPQISTLANPTPSGVATWYDPANKGRLVFPRWKLLYEHLRLLRRVPLEPMERLRCYTEIPRWMVRYHRGLIKDLLMAGKQIIDRLRTKRRLSESPGT